MSAAEKVSFLKSVSLFAEIPDGILADLAALLTEVPIAAGAVVFEKGAYGDSMYIVAHGRVRVHDAERTLNYLERGDVFGEMALLDIEPRSASVTAVEATRLLRLERASLYQLMETRVEVARGLIQILCRRLRARLHDMAEDFISLRDLQIAREIQLGFLPDALPRVPGWEVAAHFQPAREVGGDFYDAFTLMDSRYAGFVIADVCNKGVGAALYMALFRTLIRAFGQHLADHGAADAATAPCLHDLQDVVMRTNQYITHTHERAMMFATLFFGVLDPATGRLTYVNGGHEPPVIVGPRGVKARLPPTGPAVGLLADGEFDVQAIALEPGDTLFAYTDGLTEAADADQELFGDERLLSLLATPAPSATALVERVDAARRRHTGGADQSDDITMLAIRRSALYTDRGEGVL